MQPMLTEQQIQQICEEIQQDAQVQGILLTSSYVYGTPHQDSDLDLHIVTNDGTNWRRDKQSRPFGTQADFHYGPPEAVRDAFAKSRQTGDPPIVFGWAYGVIVYDPTGIVAQLQQEAREIWQAGPYTGDWIPREKYRNREIITRKEYLKRF